MPHLTNLYGSLRWACHQGSGCEDAGVDELPNDGSAGALVAAGEWVAVTDAQDHALVVLAMGIDCGVYLNETGTYEVRVAQECAGRVIREWREFDEEQAAAELARRAPVVPEGQGFPLRMDLAWLWLLSLLVVFWTQGQDPGLSDRFCNSTRAMLDDGEWWRPFTSLFLHADGAHLLGNALLGGVFCVLVAQAFGALRGWVCILGCGTLANALNAAAHWPGDFRSLGASTATFAALGLLVGHAVRNAWRMRSLHGLRPLLVPLIAGGILLGWFGGGGADAGNIDVAGHVVGWCFGVVAGFVFHRLPGD